MNSKIKNLIPADGLAGLKENFKTDAISGFIVFLLALPLSLGIAKASEFPPIMGLITAIIGGIVASFFMGSRLTIKGPAAGLIVIVAGAVAEFGKGDNELGWKLALGAMVVAGIIQILFGVLKLGKLADFFPLSTIHGMLAAIGVILILKQIPHAVGYDKDFEGDEGFSQVGDENTFTALLSAFDHINFGAVIISSIAIAVLIFWPKIKQLSSVPAALIVVVLGIALGNAFDGTNLALMADQKVQIPIVNDFDQFIGLFTFPDFSNLANKELWRVAITIAIVASLETLLSLEAVDKIDPIKRVSPTNRELIAQGVGNTFAGLIGGLPMTAVIVRSSANVMAGGRTKMSATIVTGKPFTIVTGKQ